MTTSEDTRLKPSNRKALREAVRAAMNESACAEFNIMHNFTDGLIDAAIKAYEEFNNGDR